MKMFQSLFRGSWYYRYDISITCTFDNCSILLLFEHFRYNYNHPKITSLSVRSNHSFICTIISCVLIVPCFLKPCTLHLAYFSNIHVLVSAITIVHSRMFPSLPPSLQLIDPKDLLGPFSCQGGQLRSLAFSVYSRCTSEIACDLSESLTSFGPTAERQKVAHVSYMYISTVYRYTCTLIVFQ